MQPWTVEITRGALTESSHLGHGAVVDAQGQPHLIFGDSTRNTFPRSAMKWIQGLELVMSGAADAFAMTDAELALACASHNGEPEHVSAVTAVLKRLRLDADDLECGISLPFTDAVRLKLSYERQTATQLHHCCSGKHVGMLAVCQHLGFPIAGYTEYDHPLQVRIRNHISDIFSVDAHSLPFEADGCSVPTYAMPLDLMAHGFARLAAEHCTGPMNQAAKRLRLAQASAPFMVAGTDRLDTALLEAGQGRLQVKMGAEGVYCGALADRELGFALKCEDGSLRGQEALVIALLDAIGEHEILARLPDKFRNLRITTARGAVVGEISVRRG
mgnify:FL=1